MKINILLMFFFDSWPSYMLTFFHSAAYSNPKVTFTLITNLNFSHASWSTSMFDIPVPPNVVLLPATFKQLQTRFSTKDALGLGYPVNFATPYKLADFAPAYGQMFEDQLDGYSHWGYAGTDVFIGNILDIYEKEYQDENVLHFEKRLYFNSLTILKNDKLGRSMYQLAGDKTVKFAFHNSPKNTLGFDEEILTCPLMFKSEVRARYYDSMCDLQFFWYKGNLFNNKKKCVMHHFGGGHRRKLVSDRRDFIVAGLTPFFKKKYYLDPKIGYGIWESNFLYFTVNQDLSLKFIEYVPLKANTTLSKSTLKKYSELFKDGRKQLYPAKNGRVQGWGTPKSVARVGNITDRSPFQYLGRKCKEHIEKNN